MGDMGDDFRAMRDYKRDRKNSRARKFDAQFDRIHRVVQLLGWSVHRWDLAWVFRQGETGASLKWWPASGKTETGEYLGTWPDVLAKLRKLAREAE